MDSHRKGCGSTGRSDRTGRVQQWNGKGEGASRKRFRRGTKQGRSCQNYRFDRVCQIKAEHLEDAIQ